MTKQLRTGLILAIINGVFDFLFLGTYTGSGDHPTVAVGVLSVVIGVVTFVAIAKLWRAPNAAWLWVLIGTRVLDVLGDIAGFFQNTPAIGIAITVVLLVLDLWCLYALSPSVSRRRATSSVDAAH